MPELDNEAFKRFNELCAMTHKEIHRLASRYGIDQPDKSGPALAILFSERCGIVPVQSKPVSGKMVDGKFIPDAPSTIITRGHMVDGTFVADKE